MAGIEGGETATVSSSSHRDGDPRKRRERESRIKQEEGERAAPWRWSTPMERQPGVDDGEIGGGW